MPFPNIADSNVTDLTGVMSFDNTVTAGLFGPMILFTVWAITFIGLSSSEKSKSFTAANWLTWFLSLLLWAAGLVSESVMMTLGLLSLVSAMYLLYISVKGPGWN